MQVKDMSELTYTAQVHSTVEVFDSRKTRFGALNFSLASDLKMGFLIMLSIYLKINNFIFKIDQKKRHIT